VHCGTVSQSNYVRAGQRLGRLGEKGKRTLTSEWEQVRTVQLVSGRGVLLLTADEKLCLREGFSKKT